MGLEKTTRLLDGRKLISSPFLKLQSTRSLEKKNIVGGLKAREKRSIGIQEPDLLQGGNGLVGGTGSGCDLT